MSLTEKSSYEIILSSTHSKYSFELFDSKLIFISWKITETIYNTFKFLSTCIIMVNYTEMITSGMKSAWD